MSIFTPGNKRNATAAQISPISTRIFSSSITKSISSMINSLISKASIHNDPELAQFADQMRSFSSLFDSINQTITTQFIALDEKINKKLDQIQQIQTTKDDHAQIRQEIDEKERQRSLVISGIAEQQFQSPTQRNEYDSYRVCELLDFLHVEAKPVCVYRMGRKGNRPRLTKVVMPASIFQKLALKNANSLRKHHNGYVRDNIYIRTSLTKEQRQEASILQKKLQYLNKKNNHIYCLYAGVISVKSVADEFGRRPKPKAVPEDQLELLLAEYDPNATPLNPRRRAQHDRENFQMEEED